MKSFDRPLLYHFHLIFRPSCLIFAAAPFVGRRRRSASATLSSSRLEATANLFAIWSKNQVKVVSRGLTVEVPKVFIALICAATILGCSNGYQLNEVNRTVTDIRTAIKNLYGVESVSDNEREIITRPMKRDPNDTTPADKLTEKIYARIVIIGDRRPYDLLVEVYVLRKTRSGKFVETELDPDLSKDIAREVHRALIESRENWNVIDDFRAF
ncbi:MAG: hypothetical protein C5B49_08305 [Bdellovibrio sp.]|nr:MAG: hypothetical protein C5B49_08305 [Bdellovibrio sp.]